MEATDAEQAAHTLAADWQNSGKFYASCESWLDAARCYRHAGNLVRHPGLMRLAAAAYALAGGAEAVEYIKKSFAVCEISPGMPPGLLVLLSEKDCLDLERGCSEPGRVLEAVKAHCQNIGIDFGQAGSLGEWRRGIAPETTSAVAERVSLYLRE